MAEMRAWVLAQLLWNPGQDDRALIREFLDGYYGAAGKPLERYLELMEKASESFNLTIGTRPDASFLHFETLAKAESLWQEAEAAVAQNDDLLARVRQGHLAVQYVWLSRWNELRRECAQSAALWPITAVRDDFARQWLAAAQGVPEKPWTTVTTMKEGTRFTPEEFVSQITGKP
jgi:hypothetical protein